LRIARFLPCPGGCVPPRLRPVAASRRSGSQ
jgi:hypothetical protein